MQTKLITLRTRRWGNSRLPRGCMPGPRGGGRLRDDDSGSPGMGTQMPTRVETRTFFAFFSCSRRFAAVLTGMWCRAMWPLIRESNTLVVTARALPLGVASRMAFPSAPCSRGVSILAARAMLASPSRSNGENHMKLSEDLQGSSIAEREETARRVHRCEHLAVAVMVGPTFHGTRWFGASGSVRHHAPGLRTLLPHVRTIHPGNDLHPSRGTAVSRARGAPQEVQSASSWRFRVEQ